MGSEGLLAATAVTFGTMSIPGTMPIPAETASTRAAILPGAAVLAGAAAAGTTAAGAVSLSAAIVHDAHVAAVLEANQAWKEGRITTAQYVEIAEKAKNAPVANAGAAQGAGQYARQKAIDAVRADIQAAQQANAQSGSNAQQGTKAKSEATEATAAGAPFGGGGNAPQSGEEDPEENQTNKTKGVAGKDPPGNGRGWTRLKGDQGWRDSKGNIWKKDKLHKDHWDIFDRKGNKIREVDFDGNQIWPGGRKNKNK